ncbi:MAG: energy transducer TonB [Acidobacteria bacterium]|nr:energy transducer TonB [Acidobacteriota bacterium]
MKRITMVLFAASVALFLLSLGNTSLVLSGDESMKISKISSSEYLSPPSRNDPAPADVEGVTYPVRKKFTAPRYPSIARRTMIEADVILQLVIRKDGTVGNVEPLKVQINTNPKIEAAFIEQATKAVKKWRYQPVQQNGKPVDVKFTVVIRFREG